MEATRKCKEHKNEYEFFCYDDHEFVCFQCFSNHKRHKIEIKSDIEKSEKNFNNLKNSNKTKILDKFNSYSENLNQMQELIIKEIKRIYIAIDEIKSQEMMELGDDIKSVFDLSYQQYENLEKINNSKINYSPDSMQLFTESFQKLVMKIKENWGFSRKKHDENSFKWLQKEINVFSSSKYYGDYSPDIMLDKKHGSYYLGEGNKNHWVIFDLNKVFFVKSFKIMVDHYDCSLQDFSVSVQLEKDDWKKIKDFKCEHYSKQNGFQEFSLEQEGKIFKFEFINNWGSMGGDYILVKKLLFNASPLI